MSFEGWTFAVDPGVNGIGWARFFNERLDACGYAPFEVTTSPRHALAVAVNYAAGDLRFVIERPQVYGGRSSKGDTQDLLALSVVVGRLAEIAWEVALVEAELVYPRQWKGQRSKKVDHPLTVSRLSGTERLHLSECKAPGALLHNVIDAIGIGLWKVGRR